MNEDIKALMQLDRSELIGRWVALFERPVPRHISMPMMRRIIGYELQARSQGDLPTSTRRRLDSLARPGSKVATQTQATGSRLIREWNGITHVVEVREDGFYWQDRRFRSLSAIARAITGVRWSGPRFFQTPRKQGRQARQGEQ